MNTTKTRRHYRIIRTGEDRFGRNTYHLIFQLADGPHHRYATGEKEAQRLVDRVLPGMGSIDEADVEMAGER